jgi:hypothetical protein
LPADAAAEHIVSASICEADAPAAGDGEAIALGQDVVAKDPFKAHAEGIRSLEAAPICADAEAFVAGKVGTSEARKEVLQGKLSGGFAVTGADKAAPELVLFAPHAMHLVAARQALAVGSLPNSYSGRFSRLAAR